MRCLLSLALLTVAATAFAAPPACDRPPDAKYELKGPLADYLRGVSEQWLKVAPAANPGMLEMFRERLSEEERQLADLRAAGVRWDEIAARLNGHPEALRKKLDRAVQRVARSLGLEYGEDEE